MVANREFYERHLRGYTNKKLTILAVGVFRGESIVVWSQYFPKATIVAVDWHTHPAEAYRPVLEAKGGFKVDNVKLLQASSTDTSQFRALVASNDDLFRMGADIIIDDGCHTTQCVKSTFENVHGLLNPGGLYFVEDNAEHFEWMRQQGNWTFSELKNSAVLDAEGTPNSNRKSMLSVFKKPC